MAEDTRKAELKEAAWEVTLSRVSQLVLQKGFWGFPLSLSVLNCISDLDAPTLDFAFLFSYSGCARDAVWFSSCCRRR